MAKDGQRLCKLIEIPDGEARGFAVETAGGPQDNLLHREGQAVRGHVNSCPHVRSPLDSAPDGFIAPDGFHLMCATHGALFRSADGYCVAGPCANDSLAPAPIRLIGEDVLYIHGDPVPPR